MGKFLYAFAAKDIQNYILRGDKLKEMVGGSELIDSLCQDYFQLCLDRLEINRKNYQIITQAAGWARVLFEESKDALLIRKYWPFWVNQFAPGLHVVQSIEEITGTFSKAVDDCERGLIRERNSGQPELPEIGPLVNRNPRTGFAATNQIHKSDGKETKELEDRQSKRKRQMYESDRKRLIQKIAGNEVTEKWPEKMEEISDVGKKYIAIIHADGNSLGEIIIKLKEHLKNKSVDDAVSIFKGLSTAIEEATVQSAQAAYREVLLRDYTAREPGKKVMAARPIVIGGDDLTIIVRADLAFDFTKIFLEEFEKASENSLSNNLAAFKINGLPRKLTACAGIAFVKDGYPFSRAYELAESLCRHTKTVAKDTLKEEKDYVPSGFSFYRVSTSITGSYSAIKTNELLSKEGVSFCFGPYGVGEHAAKLPSFKSLTDLSKTLNAEGMPSGSIRQLITTLYTSKLKAHDDFSRILQVLRGGSNAVLADRLKAKLEGLTQNVDSPLWKTDMRSPLLDAHRLSELSPKGVEKI